MRFRVKRGGPAAGFTFDRTAKPVQRPEPEKPVSLAQALDNPYGRYYGKARSREELLKNSPSRLRRQPPRGWGLWQNRKLFRFVKGSLFEGAGKPARV